MCAYLCVRQMRCANLTEPSWDSGSRLFMQCQTESYWWLGSWRTHYSSAAYLSGYPVLGSHRALTELILSSFVSEKDKDACAINGLFGIFQYIFNFINVTRQTTRQVIFNLNTFLYVSKIVSFSIIQEILATLYFCHVMNDRNKKKNFVSLLGWHCIEKNKNKTNWKLLHNTDCCFEALMPVFTNTDNRLNLMSVHHYLKDYYTD